ncbi:MAG: hypothetical protein HYY45_16150 [Deltaproteobacteria bacterium]|nr:hypothetical protein [Deltaproteobacteria bacterium]
MLLSWLHLISLAVYLGSLVGLWVMVLPVLSAIQNHEERIKMVARSLKLYNPVQSASLGVLILSGAFQLTDLKAAYRELFLRELGLTLAVKLLLSFFLIVFSTYQSMAVAHRFVRRCEQGESFSPRELQSVTRRLKTSTLAILLLTMIIVWLGVQLRRT